MKRSVHMRYGDGLAGLAARETLAAARPAETTSGSLAASAAGESPALSPVELARLRTEPWMLTLSGRAWFPLSPAEYRYDITEIATALSREPRFSGHTRPDQPAYSVAQHSVLVATQLGGHGARMMRAALLHDASEAFLKDVPSPIKRLLGATYKGLEDACTEAIFIQFGLDGLQSHPLIKHADRVLLATEKRDLRLPNRFDDWQWDSEAKPLEQRIIAFSASEAAAWFTSAWRLLGGAL